MNLRIAFILTVRTRFRVSISQNVALRPLSSPPYLPATLYLTCYNSVLSFIQTSIFMSTPTFFAFICHLWHLYGTYLYDYFIVIDRNNRPLRIVSGFSAITLALLYYCFHPFVTLIFVHFLAAYELNYLFSQTYRFKYVVLRTFGYILSIFYLTHGFHPLINAFVLSHIQGICLAYIHYDWCTSTPAPHVHPHISVALAPPRRRPRPQPPFPRLYFPHVARDRPSAAAA